MCSIVGVTDQVQCIWKDEDPLVCSVLPVDIPTVTKKWRSDIVPVWTHSEWIDLIGFGEKDKTLTYTAKIQDKEFKWALYSDIKLNKPGWVFKSHACWETFVAHTNGTNVHFNLIL